MNSAGAWWITQLLRTGHDLALAVAEDEGDVEADDERDGQDHHHHHQVALSRHCLQVCLNSTNYTRTNYSTKMCSTRYEPVLP